MNKDPLSIVASPTSILETPEAASQEEAELVASVMLRFDDAKNSTNAKRQQWEYNNLILQGETPTISRADSSVMRVIVEGDPRQPRSTDNMICALHRAFVGKMTRTIPTSRVSPRTADKDDVLAAELMESFLDFMWNKEKLKLKYKRAVESISTNGTGIWHIYWDSNAGRDVGFCPKCGYADTDKKPGEPCPACYAQTDMEMQAPGMEAQVTEMEGTLLQKAKEGDLRVDLIDSEDFYPDPGAQEIEDCQYVILCKVLPVNVIRRMFPERSDFVSSEGELYADRYIYAPSNSLSGAHVNTVKLYNHAKLYTCFEAPTGEHEQGRIIYICNGRVLDIRANIYHSLLGRHPFYLARGDRRRKCLWGEELITQAEAIQRERDTLCTQVRRHREMTMSPPIIADSMSGIDDKTLSTRAGQVIKVKRGGYIKALQLPQLPSFTPNELDRLKLAAQEKFSVTQAELGYGNAAESGRSMAFLETQSTEAVGPLSLEINEEWLDMHKAELILGQHFMSPDRIWTVTGNDRFKRVVTNSWSKANIQPGWDVFLSQSDSLSKNPVLRLQQAQGLLQTGYYGDPQTGAPDFDRFRRDAGLASSTTPADTEMSEYLYASQLPSMIEEALLTNKPEMIPQPAPWDNAPIMASELLYWLRTKGRTGTKIVRDKVAEMWFQYAEASLGDQGQPASPSAAKSQPNQKLMGAQGMGAGQVPGQTRQATPQEQAMGQQTLPNQDTANLIQGADKMAEQNARMSMRQEGTTV